MFFLAVGLLGSNLAGQEPEPIVTDRPDQTESAAIVAPGVIQLEWGSGFARHEDENLTAHELTLASALARIGIVRRVELRLGFDGWTSQESGPTGGATATESGAGDAELGVKVGIVDGAGLSPAIAVIGGVGLPTGHEAFGSPRVTPSAVLVLSHDLSPRLALGYNVGLLWDWESAGATTTSLTWWRYTATLGIGVSERVGAFVESFGHVGLEDAAPSEHSLDGGFTLQLRPNLQLDTSGGIGVSGVAPDWFMGLGVSVRVPR